LQGGDSVSADITQRAVLGGDTPVFADWKTRESDIARTLFEWTFRGVPIKVGTLAAGRLDHQLIEVEVVACRQAGACRGVYRAQAKWVRNLSEPEAAKC
jgi:hypothetical protein